MSNLIPTDGEAMLATSYGRCPAGPAKGKADLVGRNKILAFPADAGAGREQQAAALTDLIADMVRMSSVLSSLLDDRIRDTGKGALTVGRRDAADIQFVAGQASACADRVQQAWEALP